MSAAIVVFGGSGFIGTHLLRRLAATGGTRLYSYDRRSPRMPVDGVEYITADVCDLSAVVLPSDVSRIYNFAAVHTTPGHPFHEYYETNILGALEITKLAERSGVEEIVFTSSISVYGPGESTKSEATPLAPVSAYGWSKMMAERIHRAWYDRKAGRRLTIVRPAVIFGRGEGGNFTRMATLLRKGIFIYPGRRDTIKACFYVEDLLDAIKYARSTSDPFVVFNGCYPDRYTIEQIVETFKTTHFPDVRTYMIPRAIITIAAKILQYTSFLNLGIHPDRVKKLVESTDIEPSWLISQGVAPEGRLPSALQRWSADSNDSFI